MNTHLNFFPSYGFKKPYIDSFYASVYDERNISMHMDGIDTFGCQYKAKTGFCWSFSNKIPSRDIDDYLDMPLLPYGVTSLVYNSTFAEASTYYIRGYASNIAGITYTDTVTVYTLGGNASIPTISTNSITNIGRTTFTSGGVVSSDGGANITSKGICWSKYVNPTEEMTTKTNDGTGTSSFTSNISGLDPFTTYHVRAYATNSEGTGYGLDRAFTTDALGLPSPHIYDLRDFTTNSGHAYGNISDDGGSSITAKGFTWNTTGNPTMSDHVVPDGNGIDNFDEICLGMPSNTNIFISAYATNSSGTAISPDAEFNTLSDLTLPGVITTNITNIASSSAISGGSIPSDGGSYIISKGIVWSTSTNPTTTNHVGGGIFTNGSGNSSFTSYMQSLSVATKYYVKAYAINSVGIAYGNEISFWTASTFTNTGFSIAWNTGAPPIVNVNRSITITPSLLFSNYHGAPWNTLVISSINTNYDGDANDFIKWKNNNTIITSLPISIDISSLLADDNTSLSVGIEDPTGALLSANTRQKTQIIFKIIDENGIESYSTGSPIIELAEIYEHINSVSDITSSSATVNGLGYATAMIENAFYYGTNPSVSLLDTKVVVQSTQGGYSKLITGLTPNTTYYVRGFVKYGNGDSELGGNTVSFTTPKITIYLIPQVNSVYPCASTPINAPFTTVGMAQQAIDDLRNFCIWTWSTYTYEVNSYESGQSIYPYFNGIHSETPSNDTAYFIHTVSLDDGIYEIVNVINGVIQSITTYP